MRRRPYYEDDGPRRLETSLDAVSKQLGVEESRGLAALFAHWGEMVGPAMAEHVRPLRLDGDLLVVAVDHPAWATQVRHLSDDLLARIAEGTGIERPLRLEVRIRR